MGCETSPDRRRDEPAIRVGWRECDGEGRRRDVRVREGRPCGPRSIRGHHRVVALNSIELVRRDECTCSVRGHVPAVGCVIRPSHGDGHVCVREEAGPIDGYNLLRRVVRLVSRECRCAVGSSRRRREKDQREHHDEECRRAQECGEQRPRTRVRPPGVPCHNPSDEFVAMIAIYWLWYTFCSRSYNRDRY